jgi:hypothetical protein
MGFREGVGVVRERRGKRLELSKTGEAGSIIGHQVSPPTTS